MSDTPRTDAADLIVPSDLGPEEQWRRNGQYISAEFARQLERDLAALRAEYETAVTTGMAYAAEAAALRAERDRLAAEVERLKAQLDVIEDLAQFENDPVFKRLCDTLLARRALGEE